MDLTVEERVQAGVVWLNENHPGWLGKIDLETLDIRSIYNCVMAQLYGSWRDSPFYRRPSCHPSPASLGFERSGENQDRDNRELNTEWRRVITALREEQV